MVFLACSFPFCKWSARKDGNILPYFCICFFPNLFCYSLWRHNEQCNSPGQEEGNIPFVENAGFGKYSGNPSEIADTVGSWLADPERLKTMQDAALGAARPHATLDIAKDLAEMVFAEKEKQKALERELVASS